MKKILITGATSLFGKYLTRVLNNYSIIGTYHTIKPSKDINIKHFIPLNILDLQALKNIIHSYKPEYVIHLAALSNIDFCEKHPQHAYRVNVEGTKNICQVLSNKKIHLIFASSNAVFDGYHAPYTELQQPQPINVYGTTKYQAEKFISTSKLDYTIARFTSMFGWSPIGARDNDVTYYLSVINKTKQMFLVKDKFFNPINALTAAYAVRKIIQMQFKGIIHIAGPEKINRYQLIKQVVQIFAPDTKTQLIPVNSNYFPSLAPRPNDATLSIDKMKSIIGIFPGSLKYMLQQLKQE